MVTGLAVSKECEDMYRMGIFSKTQEWKDIPYQSSKDAQTRWYDRMRKTRFARKDRPATERVRRGGG